ncbi:MAG: hypothetical protein IKE24_05610 [Clostridia bacterium]|nr:hypothetical protein [Clostridia bacterium]
MLDRHIFLIGMPGCGKRSLGRRAARELGLPFTDLEEWLAEGMGISPAELRARQGEAENRRMEAAALAWLTRARPGIITVGAATPLNRANLGIMRGWGSLILIDRPLEEILADFQPEKYPEMGDNPEGKLREMEETLLPELRKAADVRMPDKEDEETAYALFLRILKERYHA